MIHATATIEVEEVVAVLAHLEDGFFFWVMEGIGDALKALVILDASFLVPVLKAVRVATCLTDSWGRVFNCCVDKWHWRLQRLCLGRGYFFM